MTQEQAQKAIYERFENGGFKGFNSSMYNEKLDYIKITETNPMLDKHMYELVLFCTERDTHSMYSKTVFTFTSYKEMTYEQFKAALKNKYNLVIPGKRKLVAKNTIVAAYNISDKMSFYIGPTIEAQNMRFGCMELANNDYVVKEDDSDYYMYTRVPEFNSGIKEGKSLKPLLRECGSDNVNDFYKFVYNENTYYALKDKVDKFFVDFPNIARNCYPFKHDYTFFDFPVI